MSLKTYPLDNVDYAAEDAELFHCTRSSGIYANDDFDYSVTGADNTITIGVGLGWIRNSKFSGKVVALKAALALDMGLPDAVYPRIDAVVIQFDANKNGTEIVVKKGVAATAPVPPVVSRTEALYELHLYHVRREPGVAAVTASGITDLRMDTNYCGLMADSVTVINTIPTSHELDRNNPHKVTAAQIDALSNKGWSDYATVLEAAMSMPTPGGSFFAVMGKNLFNAADSAFPNQEATYFMLTDECSDPRRRTVIAIPYGSGATVKYRTIWAGGWQTDWKDIASPADIGAATAFELTATIPASGWFSIAGGSAYENDLDVAGVLGTDKVEVDVRMDDTSWDGIANNILLEEEFAKIYQIPVSDGRLWIRARELPTVDIPIKIKVVR